MALKIVFIFILSLNVFAGLREKLAEKKFDTLFNSNKPDFQPNTSGTKGNTLAQMSARCQQLQSLGAQAQAILTQYESKVIPYIGQYPSFAIGAYSTASVLDDICDLVVGYERFSGKQLWDFSKRFLNYVTDSEFADELSLVDGTYNVANSIYDMNSGEFRPGALTSPATHRKFVQFNNQVVKYYNKNAMKNGGETIETKASRQKEMNNIARLASKQAVLGGFLDCPEEKSRINYLSKYNKTIPKLKEDETNSKKAFNFYHSRLVLMGKDMLGHDTEKYNEYIKELEELEIKGVTFKQRKKSVNIGVDTYDTGKTNKDDQPIIKEKEVNKDVNIFSANKNDVFFKSFSKKYVPLWGSYITKLKYTSGLDSLLNNKEGKLTRKYRSLAIECSEFAFSIGSGKGLTGSEYNSRLEKFEKECKESLPKDINEKDIDNLFDKFFVELEKNLLKHLDSKAQIWNFEAENMGIVRDVGVNADELNLNDLSKKTKCTTTLSISEYQAASIQFDMVNSQVKEQIFQTQVQRTMLKEAQAKKKHEDQEKSKELIDNAKKTQENTTFDTIVPSNVRPTIKW